MAKYNHLQIREIFHLEFLRRFTGKIKASEYALKGGVNLRFFFQSMRYSEDMDIDVCKVSVHSLQTDVMGILQAKAFQEGLKPFGVDKVVVPDMAKAKQTETTQRFKIHLLTLSGEDLFTKVEFSRRGFKGETGFEALPPQLLRSYSLAPLLVSHYGAAAALTQKIEALAGRPAVQARDIFDLFLLMPQCALLPSENVERRKLAQARENVFSVSYEQFRDAVLAYLDPEERSGYARESAWDEIKLKVLQFLEETGGRRG